MQGRGEKPSQQNGDVEVEGLPVIRPKVAGIDLGSNEHWVCAPRVGGSGRRAQRGRRTVPLQRAVAGLRGSVLERAHALPRLRHWLCAESSPCSVSSQRV